MGCQNSFFVLTEAVINNRVLVTSNDKNSFLFETLNCSLYCLCVSLVGITCQYFPLTLTLSIKVE